MATVDELAAVVDGAQSALDAANKQTLDSFRDQMAGGTFTVASFMAAFDDLQNQLGGKDPKAQAANLSAAFHATLDAFNAWVDGL